MPALRSCSSTASSLGPSVLVLVLVSRLDGVFPARSVSLVPFLRRVHGGAGIGLPGLRIRLALVLTLLVDNHLRALAASRQGESPCKRRDAEPKCANGFHVLPPAGGCDLGVSGLPYAVPQPQTSEPLPR